MMSIVYSSFVNTGILTLLTNADLSYVPGLSSVLPLHMQYSDLGEGWYLVIGTALVKTMMINAFMPWMLLGVDICKWKAK